jgi:hypothetical protein
MGCSVLANDLNPHSHMVVCLLGDYLCALLCLLR